eukprot:SAG31_NODE_36550_length_312_cov_0.948357_1_plen_104_part_11
MEIYLEVRRFEVRKQAMVLRPKETWEGQPLTEKDWDDFKATVNVKNHVENHMARDYENGLGGQNGGYIIWQHAKIKQQPEPWSAEQEANIRLTKMPLLAELAVC